jgi:hypothetical protein
MLKRYILVATLLFGALPLLAEEPYNYGEIWKAWDPAARSAYISGYVDGCSLTYLAASAWLPGGEAFRKPESGRVKRVTEECFLVFENDSISKVMTDLYNDPANVFILHSSMILIARDKLRGDDVENKLKEARRYAIRTYELNEKMKNKGKG